VVNIENKIRKLPSKIKISNCSDYPITLYFVQKQGKSSQLTAHSSQLTNIKEHFPNSDWAK